MEINQSALKKYLEDLFGGSITRIKMSTLGKGCIGIGYLLEFETSKNRYRRVLKCMYSEHLGSDYPADRAQSLILAHHTYNRMDNHVESLDVVGVDRKGNILPVGKAEDFYILMDEAKGKDFFSDLRRIAAEKKFTKEDKERVVVLAKYLAELHAKRFQSESLYRRKIRDTVGSGVSIMGILDMYPEKVSWFSHKMQAELVKKAIEHWSEERYRSDRLCEIHGDFHPGNIWFRDSGDFILLDRSRGQFGEAADDITAFLINFIFYSVMYEGGFTGPLAELCQAFIDNYLKLTKDKDLGKVISPYWAFRTVVVCNPHPAFYPDSFFESQKKAKDVRKKMLNFAFNSLEEKNFNWKKIDSYLH